METSQEQPPPTKKEFSDYFRKKFVHQRDGKRIMSVGAETENLHVSITGWDFGESIGISGNQTIFNEFIKRYNGSPGLCPNSGQLVEVLFESGFKVQGEYGISMIEMNNLPAEADFVDGKMVKHPVTKLSEAVDRRLRALASIARDNGMTTLTIGTTPLTGPTAQQVFLYKGRYKTLDTRFLEVDKDGIKFVYHNAINSSYQMHISLEDELVNYVNVRNAVSGLICAGFGNSSLLAGKDSGYCEFRPIQWYLLVAGNPGDKERRGIPQRPFNDIDDLFETIISLSPVMTKHESIYVEYFDPPSFEQMIEQGYVDIIEPGDRFAQTTVRRIPMKLQDLDALQSFIWWHVRPSPYGTGETRNVSAQPQEETSAMWAFEYGLHANLGELEEFVEKYQLMGQEGDSFDPARVLEMTCLKHGLKGSYNGIPVKQMFQKLMEISRRGLESEGLEGDYVEKVIGDRVDRGINHGDISRDLFTKHGIDALVDTYTIHEEAQTHIQLKDAVYRKAA